MGKKKRKQKTTVFISLEGKREMAFFEHLKNLFSNPSLHINISPKIGGSSDSLLEQALKNKDNYNKVYVLFDEDVKLSSEKRLLLQQAWGSGQISADVKDKDLQKTYNENKRKPVIVVSSPCSIDGVLIKLFNKQIPATLDTTSCKSSLAGIFGHRGFDDAKELAYFQEHLSKEYIQSRRDIPQIDLLLSIFE